MQPSQLYVVIGHPLGHSLSPALHNWAFAATALPGVYMAFPREPGTLAAFFAAVRALPISGGNITLPFKVESMAFMDEVSPRARRVGAINTFWWKDGRLCGENTDITGFMAPLAGVRAHSALVLGAGGVSRAAIVGLQELGIPEIAITNRTASRAAALAGEFGIACLPWEERAARGWDLVVNATNQGMKGPAENASAFPAEGFAGRTGLAYDIVYTPERTRFLAEAQAAGWKTQSGVAMFVEQGREAFRLWTGVAMPEEGSYALVRQALAAKG